MLDILTIKFFVWGFGWNGELLDSHLFFFARYSELADECAARGLTTRAERLGALAEALPRPEVEAQYSERFMTALQAIATARRHTNVLQHMAGHLKNMLEPASRAELAATIEDYRRVLVPLIVPITLIRHYVRRFNVE